MDMVKAGEINCIIVKDLSRFGRNYVDVGTYLEKVFPFLRVRFISVNDAYDSMDPHCVGSLESAFKNLLNDLYSKDCSVKVKNGKRTTAMQGKFQNPWAPMGVPSLKRIKAGWWLIRKRRRWSKEFFRCFWRDMERLKSPGN